MNRKPLLHEDWTTHGQPPIVPVPPCYQWLSAYAVVEPSSDQTDRPVVVTHRHHSLRRH